MNQDYEPIISGKAIAWIIFWAAVAITPLVS